MLISDAMVETAFDWLKDNASPAAAAKADRIRAEHGVKIVKAHLFRKAEPGSIAEREAWALDHPEYEEAVELEAAAVQLDEFHRLHRNKCEAIIEAWRTEQASLRAMGKVG